MPTIPRRAQQIILLLIFGYALITRLAFLDRPFQRDPESCGAFYGVLARNFIRWPLSQTHGVPVQSLGIGHGPPVFYPNHPPLLPMFIALTYRAFGWSAASTNLPGEWQTRFSSALFTLACIGAVYVLLRKYVGFRAAALGAFFFASAPMTLLFGGQPDVINTQLVFFILLTILAYLRFHDRPSIGNLALLVAAFFPAALTDWPAFHVVPVLGLHFVCTQNWKRWPWIIAFGVISIGLFMIPYGMGVEVKHDWHWMSKLVERRTVSTVADSAEGSFTAWGWFKTAVLGHAYRRHNGLILPLMLVWIVLAVKVWRHRPETRLIALMLGWALLHVLVGRQGVYVHEWWWWPLTAGACMAAAVTLDGFFVLWERHFVGGLRVDIPIAVLLLAPAAWNTMQVNYEWNHPKQMKQNVTYDPRSGEKIIVNDPLNYSLAEIGRTIRESAPPNTAVLLGENDLSLGFWYYADRPLVQNVWGEWDFENKIAKHQTDLSFIGYNEEWNGTWSAYILPKLYAHTSVAPFMDYLDQRYPRRETEKFIVWDLTRSNQDVFEAAFREELGTPGKDSGTVFLMVGTSADRQDPSPELLAKLQDLHLNIKPGSLSQMSGESGTASSNIIRRVIDPANPAARAAIYSVTIGRYPSPTSVEVYVVHYFSELGMVSFDCIYEFREGKWVLTKRTPGPVS